MDNLKTLTIDGVSADIPNYSAGTNITITNDVIDIKESPSLSGTPTTPTAATATNTTQIASTAFTKAAIKDAMSPTIGGTAENLSLPNITTHFRTVVNSISKKGILVGRAYVVFTAKAGGFREVYPAIYRNSEALTLPGIKVDQPSNSTTRISVPVVVNVQVGDAIRIYMQQSSGSTISTGNISFEGVVLGTGL